MDLSSLVTLWNNLTISQSDELIGNTAMSSVCSCCPSTAAIHKKCHFCCNQTSNENSSSNQIDNSDKLLQKIANLYADKLLSDITLIVGSKTFFAHRLILCASSDVFQVMLMNSNWSESKESRIFLTEDPTSAAVFPEFLQYLYTGKIRITHHTVLPVLTLADKYNVVDLMTLCLDFMCANIISALAGNRLISWLQYTLTCHHTRVVNNCRDFIKCNFQMVSRQSDFVMMEADILASFLAMSDLVVRDEFTLFQCVTHWLQFQTAKCTDGGSLSEPTTPTTNAHQATYPVMSDFTSFMSGVMMHIRFPMMTPRQLAELLLNPIVMQYKEFFVNRMAIAMAYHKGDLHKMEDIISREIDFDRNLFFCYRLYTTDRWSVPLTIDNFKNFPFYGARTLLFSSPVSACEMDSEKTVDWSVDFYPKGVCFAKFLLIVWQGTVEMPEYVYRTVRLSVTSKSNEISKVSIGIIISAVEEGIEYVKSIVTKRVVFYKDARVLNMDDVISFDELNSIAMDKSAGTPSPYLIGLSNTVKIQIVITPYC